MTAEVKPKFSMEDRARKLAQKGIPVFPVHQEKKSPLVKGGFRVATTDTQQVEAWWQHWPDAGVGVPTGKNSGAMRLFVLDVDRRPDKDGFASLEQLGIEIPATKSHATPSGGRHYLFRDPGGVRCSSNKLAPGVDVRADGGYIVWHPAAGWPTDYTSPQADVPPALMEALHAKTGESTTQTTVDSRDLSAKLERDGLELNEANREWVSSMLDVIPADCSRDEWRDTVWAVAALGWGDDGRVLAEKWSRTAPEKFDSAEFEKLWNSFDPDGGIGVGTLVHHARQHGFQKSASTVTESLGSSVDDAAPGDILAGKVFAYLNSGQMLYVHAARRWYRWTGDRWAPCLQGEEIEAAKLSADRALDHAAKRHQANPDQGKRLLSWAGALRNARRLQAMLELARSEPEMSVASLRDFDRDPDVMGVPGGLIDLKSGQFRNATPEDRLTKQAGVCWESEAQCPQWRRFLRDVFQDDKETIDFIQRAVGYSLTGHSTEEKMFLCVGHGANGKSVFSDLLTMLLGDYHHTAPASLLTRRNSDGGPSDDLAGLCGARLLSINETAEGDRLAEQTIKRVVGREPITARFLYQSSFTFTPTFSTWSRTNHRPIVTGTDEGIWRRLLLIPFDRQFHDDEADPWLEVRLREELPGILKWAVDGAVAWYRRGLQVPGRIRRESQRYRSESDLLGQFLTDFTRPDPSGRVEQPALWLRWQRFCHDEGVTVGSKKSFTRRLAERNIPVRMSNGNRYYGGIVLL